MNEMLILRIVHVFCGVFWAGTMIFFATFLEPILRGAGPEGGRMMQRIAASRYPLVMMVVAILTLLSGLRMYQIVSSGTAGWAQSRMGIVLSTGAAVAMLAFAIGLVVNRPSAARMAQLAQAVQAGGGQPTPEQAAQIALVRARLVGATRVVATLLALTVIAMAAARYV